MNIKVTNGRNCIVVYIVIKQIEKKSYLNEFLQLCNGCTYLSYTKVNSAVPDLKSAHVQIYKKTTFSGW